jgi:hypothetical protein
VILNKGELFAKLGELLDDAEIRFAFANEEMEVEENISIDPEMNEAWITLYPKAEDPSPNGYYVGRHRKQD